MYYTLYYTEKSMCIKLHTANILNIFVSFTTSISFLFHRSQLKSHNILCFMRFLYSHSVVFHFMCLYFTKILIADKKYAVLVLNFRYFIFSKTFFFLFAFCVDAWLKLKSKGCTFYYARFWFSIWHILDVFSSFFFLCFSSTSRIHWISAIILFYIVCNMHDTRIVITTNTHREWREKKYLP